MAESGQSPKKDAAFGSTDSFIAKDNVPFWKACWNDIESLARVIIGDVALFLIVLAALMIVSLMLRFLGLFVDYEATYLRILQVLHFWAYFAVLLVFMLDLVWTVVVLLYTRRVRP